MCRHHPVFAHVETLDRRWRLSEEKSILTTTHLVTKQDTDWRQGKEPLLQLVSWVVSVGTSCALARRSEPTEYLSHNLCYLYLPYLSPSATAVSIGAPGHPSGLPVEPRWPIYFPWRWPSFPLIGLLLAWKPTPLGGVMAI